MFCFNSNIFQLRARPYCWSVIIPVFSFTVQSFTCVHYSDLSPLSCPFLWVQFISPSFQRILPSFITYYLFFSSSLCPPTLSFILFPALWLILLKFFLMHVSARLTAASAAEPSLSPPRLFSQSFPQKCFVYQHFLSFLFLIQPASASK